MTNKANKFNPLAIVFGVFVAALGGCAQQSTNIASDATVVPKSDSVAATAAIPEPQRSSLQAQIAPAQAVTINNDFGDVRLRFGGYEHQLEVTAVAQAPSMNAMPKLKFDADSATVSTYSDAPPVKGQRIDIVVFVPEKSPITVRTLSGLIEARGVKADVVLRSNTGNLTARGVHGAIDAQTDSGSVEMMIVDAATTKPQRIATSTGQIVLSFGEKANALLKMATSGLFAGEYSTEVALNPGQEPNKTASVKLGPAQYPIEIASKRGEIRLFRRRDYQAVQ